MSGRLNNSSVSASAAAVAASSAAINNITNTQQQQQLQQQQQANNTTTSNNSHHSSSGSNSNSTIVGLHYKIGKKIGEGSFGVIFEGTNMINQLPVAIKFEPRKTEAPQLRDEYRTYKHLNGSFGIPSAYYFGQEGLHNILVIDLLGPSLEDLFDWCGRRFSVRTTVQVAVQMISLIETLHSHDLIYRDIKPDNFLIGRPGQPDENQIHLVDFGMAKQYRDPRTKQHIPYREKKSLSGTARYMSINTHLGREQSRRDDLEALGHVFFYFLRGQLPWQGLKAPTNKQKYEKIGEKKRSTNVMDLCSGFPPQFAQYLEAVRNLAFEETPNYEGYRNLLLSALDDIGGSGVEVTKYDWMKLNGGKGWDLTINKKPNLHGYGHPTPPNEKERHQRHNQQRRNRHLQQQIQQTQSQSHSQALQQPQQAYQSNQLSNQQQHNQEATKQYSNGLSQPPLNSTSNALNQQQFQNKQPAPIREKVNSNNTLTDDRNQNINQQIGDDGSIITKKDFSQNCCVVPSLHPINIMMLIIMKTSCYAH